MITHGTTDGKESWTVWPSKRFVVMDIEAGEDKLIESSLPMTVAQARALADALRAAADAMPPGVA